MSPHRRLGVEEEFQLIDVNTRQLASRADEVLALLPNTHFVPELQNCVVEVNSSVHSTISDLRTELIERRGQANAVAEPLGLAIAAAGTVPLTNKGELTVSDSQRFREMSADYELLAREQLICGTQVHVDVDNRAQAVAVSAGISRYLPILLALSASSPFNAEGTDTGYASSRYLTWSRWPTTGSHAPAETEEEYDELVSTLVDTGVISDPGMIYYDIRPSTAHATIELRICDSCPSVDTISVVAGLFRALVIREIELVESGNPTPPLNPAVQRSATWRAARSGLEGDLVCPNTLKPKPAGEVIQELVEELSEQLKEYDDLDLVNSLIHNIVLSGSSAYRQRRALRRRGRLDDVVDLLLGETSGSAEIGELATNEELFAAYAPIDGVDMEEYYDEAIDKQAEARPLYSTIISTAKELGPVGLRTRQVRAERDLQVRGVTFKVTGEDQARVFPLDMMPRVIDNKDWNHLTAGIEQRTKAINYFLNDIYGDQEIVRDRRIGLDVLDRAPGYRRSGRSALRGAVRNHISGADLIFSEKDGWQILEDNVRMPSGLTFAVEARKTTQHNYPELKNAAPEGINDPSVGYQMIHDTLLAAAPPNAPDNPRLVLCSRGREDSGYFEQKEIAINAGLDLVTMDNLLVEDDILWEVHDGERTRIDVVYLRMEEDMFLSSRGASREPLRYDIQRAMTVGNLTIANALGNGVGDDKAIYAYVPTMIDYYLGESPILNSVPTYLCSVRDQRDMVLDRLDQLVVKPIDGYGGSGITVGPEATDEELALRREELHIRPEQFIAQEVVSLSTLPTFEGMAMQPRHVDLRVFSHLRAGRLGGPVTAHTVPAGLTRVAPAGSLIVNSSRGGGGKDTWIELQ